MVAQICKFPKIFLFLIAGLLSTMALGATVNQAVASPDAMTRYVATSGTDAGNCGSSSAPCRTIQYAVNQSSAGDTILVAQGTYTYNSSVDPCTSFLTTPAIVCMVDKSLTILGGYTTSNWTFYNPTVNVTVLDGQNARQGVFVLTYQGAASLTMQGFTIKNGRVRGPVSAWDPSGFGGGMFIGKAPVTLRDMVFSNNQVYGQDNPSSGVGGAGSGAAVAIDDGGQPGIPSLMERVVFDGNQSFGGTGSTRGGVAYGAVFVNMTNLTVNYATFTNNSARAGNSSGNGKDANGLAADALAGAIGGGGSNIVLSHITATGNNVTGGNAGINPGGGFGGAMHFESATSFSLSDSYFRGNTARAGNAQTGGFGAGGAILLQDIPATIDRTSFFANQAIGGNAASSSYGAGPGGGGAIYLWRTKTGISITSYLTNLIVADNYVSMGSVGNSVAGGGGGGIQVQGESAYISQSTIAGNQLASPLVSGQGLLVLASPGVGSASVHVNNSIISDHRVGATYAAAVLVQQGNTIWLTQGLFANNVKDTNNDNVPSPKGTFNDLSTMLSASSANYVSPGAPNYNYDIQVNSPAKDKAFNSAVNLDVHGHSRPFGPARDIGAVEYAVINYSHSLYLPLIRR